MHGTPCVLRCCPRPLGASDACGAEKGRSVSMVQLAIALTSVAAHPLRASRLVRRSDLCLRAQKLAVKIGAELLVSTGIELDVALIFSNPFH